MRPNLGLNRKWLNFRFQLECGFETVQIGLRFLQTRLSDVHECHAEGGCPAQPTFSIESQFGIPALLLRCSTCAAFQGVLWGVAIASFNEANWMVVVVVSIWFSPWQDLCKYVCSFWETSVNSNVLWQQTMITSCCLLVQTKIEVLVVLFYSWCA